MTRLLDITFALFCTLYFRFTVLDYKKIKIKNTPLIQSNVQCLRAAPSLASLSRSSPARPLKPSRGREKP